VTAAAHALAARGAGTKKRRPQCVVVSLFYHHPADF